MNSINKMFTNKNFSMMVTILLFILIFIIGAFTYTGFGSPQVFLNLFIDNAYLIVVSIGVTFVLISGGIDISVGSLVAFVCVFSAFLLEKGFNAVFVMILMLLIGVLGGFTIGIMVNNFKVQPFIATLAFQFLYRGLCFVVTTSSISIVNPLYTSIANYQIRLFGIGKISISVVIALIVLIISIYVLKYTDFGRSVYAVGGSEQSSSLMGLTVSKTKIGVYMVSGFCSALGGILFSFYSLSGYGLQNIGMEMDAIASAVIGGTLITGGVGNVLGTMFGTLIQGIIQTIIIFQGNLSSWWTKVVVASLLCIFIVFQRLISLRSEKLKGKLN